MKTVKVENIDSRPFKQWKARLIVEIGKLSEGTVVTVQGGFTDNWIIYHERVGQITGIKDHELERINQ